MSSTGSSRTTGGMRSEAGARLCEQCDHPIKREQTGRLPRHLALSSRGTTATCRANISYDLQRKDHAKQKSSIRPTPIQSRCVDSLTGKRYTLSLVVSVHMPTASWKANPPTCEKGGGYASYTISTGIRFHHGSLRRRQSGRPDGLGGRVRDLLVPLLRIERHIAGGRARPIQ